MKSKVMFKSFCFEITRKCNMKCLHYAQGSLRFDNQQTSDR